MWLMRRVEHPPQHFVFFVGACLTAIPRALGRYHDEEAARLIAWKFGER